MRDNTTFELGTYADIGFKVAAESSFDKNVTFNKTTTIAAPSNNFTDPTFEIRGTARTGTTDSRVFYAINSGDKLQIRYRGPIATGDEIVNKTYVDEQVAQANFQHPGMGLQWQYNGSGSATTGRFSFVKDEFLYINGETADGRKIFNDLNANQHSPHAARPLITIYRIVNNEMYLCMVLNCKETRFGYNSSGRMQFIVDAWLRPHPLNVGQNYYITVGGLC